MAFVTGHENPSKDREALDYATLAHFPGTLVFYMGLDRLEALVEASSPAESRPIRRPAWFAVRQIPRNGRLPPRWRGLRRPCGVAKLRPPSIIVVGECVNRREAIAWFEKRPLFGRRVAITRPAAQAGPVIERLIELGAEPVLLPTIEILPPEDWTPIDRVLARLGEFDWLVFTSVNGVESFLGRLWETGGDARRLGHLRIAAIGPATGDSLARFGLRPDLVPLAFRAEALPNRAYAARHGEARAVGEGRPRPRRAAPGTGRSRCDGSSRWLFTAMSTCRRCPRRSLPVGAR